MGKKDETPSEMSCKELVELVTDYIEKVLPETDRTRFEAHLAACPGCTDYVEQMRLTLRLSGRLEEESIGPEARETLLNTFRDWKKRTG